MKRTRKILAFMLVIAMVAMMLPMVASAAAAPTFESAAVNGDTLVLTYGTCALDTAAVPANTAFTVMADGSAVTVSGVAVTNGTTVTLTLASAVAAGDVVTVQYTGTTLVCDDTGIAAAIFAASPVTNNTAAAPPSNTETHEGGGGTLVPVVTYTQKQVATLPTSEGFAFVIDPQGLYYLSDEEIKALVVESGNPNGLRRLGEMAVTTACTEANCEVHDRGTGDEPCNEVRGWQLLESAGQIIFSTYHPWFTNMSNHQIALEVNFAFTDGDDDEDVIAVNTAALVDCEGDDCCTLCDSGDDPVAAVFISSTFSTANVAEAPSSFSGDLSLPILAASRTPLFILDAADYDDETTIDRTAGVITAITVEMKKNLAENAKGHGTQFMLTGSCNPNADWQAVEDNAALDLGINIVFDLTAPDATEWDFTAANLTALNASTAISGAYGLRATTALPGTSYFTRTPALTADVGGAKVGFIVGGSIVATRADLTAARGWIGVPFDTGGGTPVVTTTYGAPLGSAATYDAVEKELWLHVTTGGWVGIKITVGSQEFEFNILAT